MGHLLGVCAVLWMTVRPSGKDGSGRVAPRARGTDPRPTETRRCPGRWAGASGRSRVDQRDAPVSTRLPLVEPDSVVDEAMPEVDPPDASREVPRSLVPDASRPA